MNKQKEDIMKILISTWVGDREKMRISLIEASDQLIAREKEAQLRAINSLYQHCLPLGYRFTPEAKAVFHDHYNLISGGEELPEPEVTTERRPTLYFLSGLMVAFFISALLTLWYFRESEPTGLQLLPPVPGIIIDTSMDEHSEIPDSVRQASPEIQHVYDSERRAGK